MCEEDNRKDSQPRSDLKPLTEIQPDNASGSYWKMLPYPFFSNLTECPMVRFGEAQSLKVIE